MNDQKMVHGTGALHPSQDAWRKGKTAGSISFVMEFQRLMGEGKLVESSKLCRLLDHIVEAVKQGEISIVQSFDFEAAIKTGLFMWKE